MTKQQFFRVVAFLLVLASMFVLLCDLFENHENAIVEPRFDAYYDLEEDTLDLAFVGTSGMDRYWVAPKAYEEYGIASYSLSSNANPAWFIKIFIKEIEKHQKNVKLLVVDMRPFVVDYVDAEKRVFDIKSRRVIDALPFFSQARFEAINKALEVISENFEDTSRFDISYFINFIRYHSRWSEDNFSIEKELNNDPSEYMGTYLYKSLSLRTMDQPIPVYETDARAALDPISEEALYEVLDYLVDKDYEILFLNTPHSQKKLETERMNTVRDILEERGFKYLDCPVDPEVYDLQNDFYNTGHVNYYGSEKFTAWFTDYIYENYELPDHRGDDNYYQWVGTYDKVKETIAHWEDLLKRYEAAKAAKEAKKAKE